MTTSDSQLPQDLSACHALIEQLQQDRQRDGERLAQLEAVVEEQQTTIDDLQQTIEKLQADNKLLRRSLFGPRRERYDDPDQGLLFDATELDHVSPDSQDTQDNTEDDDSGKKDKGGKQGGGRRRRVFPDFLPRLEERHDLKDEDIPAELRDDPFARRFYKKTGERIEYEPPQLTVIEVYREVIAADHADGETTIITAPQPSRLIDSYAGTSILAYLTVSRFADHLPYYRLEDILGRSGFRIDRSTQWRWMHAVASAVSPLVDLMRRLALQSDVLNVDETPVKMLGGVGKTQTTYLWDMLGDAAHPYDCFYFTTSRSCAGPNKFLSDFRGYLQSDAYVGYDLIDQVHPGILNVSCWAHVRRKFEEVHHLGATDRTHMALAYFQRLYDIEDRCRELTDEARLAIREQESKPIVESFHAWQLEERAKLTPKSKLAGAMNYLLNRWDSFARYLEHGGIPIDNNRAEAALKYAILGRKAWLFVGHPTAGQTAANLFTLTKTCNRHHIDPLAYLQDVYDRLPQLSAEDLPSLLPDRWIAEHPQHVVEQRAQESLDRARRTRERRAARRREVA